MDEEKCVYNNNDNAAVAAVRESRCIQQRIYH